MKNKLNVIILTLSLSYINGYSHSFELKTDILKSKISFRCSRCIINVSKNGKPFYKKAFNKSIIELDVNMKPENVCLIGSMKIQFTALAIMMLVEKVKLDVHAEITKIIPDYPIGIKKSPFSICLNTHPG